MIEAKDEAEKDRYQVFLDKLRKDAAIRTGPTQADSVQSPVAVVCAKCGLENTGDKKYCVECGSLLAPSFFHCRKGGHPPLRTGIFYFQDGDYDKALFEFQQALARDPDLAEARLYLAQVHVERGEIAEALEKFRHTLCCSLTIPVPTCTWPIYTGSRTARIWPSMSISGPSSSIPMMHRYDASSHSFIPSRGALPQAIPRISGSPDR